MGNLVAILIPEFSPSSYPAVLRKLSWFLFWDVWLATSALRWVPRIDTFAASVEAPFLASPLAASHADLLGGCNPSGLVLALALAALSHAAQFHDRISDLLGIRRRFDLANILLPLAVLAGIKLSASKLDRLASSRDSLMHNVFYRFASSGAEKPLVDKHDIRQALSAWSWFWVAVEAVAISLLGFAISLAFAAWGVACAFGAAALVAMLSGVSLYPRLERYARPQVERIASDPAALLHTREAFDAL